MRAASPSNIDAAAGSVKELERIVGQIRQHWPRTQIIIRGDGGFCREAIMSWCESQKRVSFLLGLAKNDRLLRESLIARTEAHIAHLRTEQPSRVFCQFHYRTLDSWSRSRRVACKAEHLAKGENPRFVVTNLSSKVYPPKTLYEKHYCARGEMENRIKEQQLDLFADRTSAWSLRANQIRLYFASFAYVMLCTLRQRALAGTELERAQCGTIRLKLLKIGAQVRISVRRVRISFSQCFPSAELFRQVLENLRRWPACAPVP